MGLITCSTLALTHSSDEVTLAVIKVLMFMKF